MSHTIRLALVDQDDGSRQATLSSLASTGEVSVVVETGGAAELLALVGRSQPDVLLLDLATLQAGGLQVVAQVSRQHPHVGIVVLNAPGQESLVLEALQQGALGHLDKGKARPDELVAAVRAVSRNEAVLSPEIAGQILDDVVPHFLRRPPQA